MIQTEIDGDLRAATGQSVIDAAVHNDIPSVRALYDYLPPYWVEHLEQTQFKGPTETYYPANSPIAARPNSRPAPEDVPAPLTGRSRAAAAAGPPPASTVGVVRNQILGAGAEAAILCAPYPVDSLKNPDAAVAFATAFNDWQIKEWLDKEPRLRASIVVPIQVPEAAVREIERVADHPGFVQVALPVRTAHPLGNRIYHGVWEAIARHNLVAGVQFGGVPGVPPTPSGWPSYFIEEYIDMAGVFATQVTSIVCEGVFDRFPSLRVALIEAGFTWLAPHMWRFDKEWKNLRRLVPWVRRAPSEYIREHIRLTVQPLDGPDNSPRQLLEVVEQLGSDDMLMYASHFPRVHAADPETTLIRHLPDSLARKVRSENARALYGL
ncbi:MAG: amidohydrolase family protein [Chloroflexi bacterium]|nr:amidohydrolase family protein [Chloroflexota bacterium]